MHRVAARGGSAVDQDQGIFWPHAANIDLAVVATLATGGFARQVNPWHGADQFVDITRRRAFLDVFSGGVCLLRGVGHR